MQPHLTAPSGATDFSAGQRSLSSNRWLPFVLIALGTVSNVVYAHTPLVAFAAMSGVMLNRRRAIATAVLIWFINQAIGFGLRDYPFSGTALMWGALMGLGTLLVVTVSSLRPRFSQCSWVGHWLWVAIALLSGFVIYQGLIVLAYPMIADGHFMGWQIIAKLFIKQVTWGGAIALGHGVLLWQHLSQLRPSQG